MNEARAGQGGGSGKGGGGGSAPSVDAWVERHTDALWRYAMSRVRREDVAEELVQETFLAAIGSKEGFEQRSSDLTWLIGILRNKIADHFRRAYRGRGDAEGGGAGTAQADGDGADGVGADVFDRMFTSKGMWKKEQIALSKGSGIDFSDRPRFVEDLGACSEGVPKGLWEAFLMREAYGVESDEICKRLAITPTNLWSRIHRAKALLRECLAGKGWWSGNE
ncbi:MAG: sigma-70 family RNA polymerase sigma factor [Phycisphaeraceae bacterium]|nr:sigma-70 family RNA polymerase sigma factor [Phycisphaeraceae bacterium]